MEIIYEGKKYLMIKGKWYDEHYMEVHNSLSNELFNQITDEERIKIKNENFVRADLKKKSVRRNKNTEVLEYKNAQYYIDRGYIETKDDAIFRTILEVSDLFNKGYKGKQQCWFPTRYRYRTCMVS